MIVEGLKDKLIFVLKVTSKKIYFKWGHGALLHLVTLDNPHHYIKSWKFLYNIYKHVIV